MPDNARLVDANLLVALIVADHVHHALAEEWFARDGARFATCPTTQTALVRLLVREGATATEAAKVLSALTANDRHEFWADDIDVRDVPMSGVVVHRQITDCYLAALARAHESRLVTLDRGLAALHPDVADSLL
ncbi:MAG TPA: TA system VapC family ribonuclease toxin [Acidimicrobiales bacterium]|nr:TA system VapC family ribonuclease toxin [Acidimicrobiales bacterium]